MIEELRGISPDSLTGLVWNEFSYWKPSVKRMYKIVEHLFVGRALQMSGVHHKLDAKSARFSLCPHFSCPADCLGKDGCVRDCYAVADETTYKTAYNKDLGFTYLAINNVPKLEEYIRSDIEHWRKNNVDNVRIHERGDFCGQEYLDMWVRIARDYPSIIFYCFTKTRRHDGSSEFDWSGWDELTNTRWHSSYDPEGGYNFGSEEYVDSMHEKYPKSTYICPFHETHRKCGLQKGSCRLCLSEKLDGKVPLFVEHKR